MRSRDVNTIGLHLNAIVSAYRIFASDIMMGVASFQPHILEFIDIIGAWDGVFLHQPYA